VSASGAQAAAFFKDVAQQQIVWWVRDDLGSPAPRSTAGDPVFPYWSSQPRAQRAARIWGPEFRTESMTLDFWRRSALPDLARDQFRVGLNWSGPGLTGWDFTVDEVLRRLAHSAPPSS
jgi:hypothetical protein